ncbi:MAG TPA: DUF5677 domain-containing protein [Thermoleophilaceae bacterium]
MELWDPATIAQITAARKQARALGELTRRFLPATVESGNRHGDWPVTGYAMIARASGTLESVMSLFPRRRNADAAVLARALYEEVVTFAWVAIDPEENARAWVRWDRRQRLKADNDVRSVGAEPLLYEDTREDFKRQLAAGDAMPDSLARRAEHADQHWAQQLDAIEPDPASPRSFRGMYRYVYRAQSQFAHAAPHSIESFVHNSPQPGHQDVILSEGDPSTPMAFTLSPALYALALQVAEPTLSLDGITPALETIFTRYPHEQG